MNNNEQIQYWIMVSSLVFHIEEKGLQTKDANQLINLIIGDDTDTCHITWSWLQPLKSSRVIPRYSGCTCVSPHFSTNWITLEEYLDTATVPIWSICRCCDDVQNYMLLHAWNMLEPSILWCLPKLFQTFVWMCFLSHNREQEFTKWKLNWVFPSFWTSNIP